MSAAAALFSAGVSPPWRSASGVVAKPEASTCSASTFYSWSKTISGGESIRSVFTVGGCGWHVHYYPNGADAARPDSGSISFYLRLDDHEARSACSAPPATPRTSSPPSTGPDDDDYGRVHYYEDYFDEDGNEIEKEVGPPEELGRGYADFISKEELERRRETVLKDDSLAVLELNGLYLGQRYRQRPDDRQYIRRCLAEQRHRE
ncbi:LOW QUALITY PROTEIN: hypothetical protein SETIT_6G057800v2 [Setaria italica]|uniref:MATH domain-containing protein n=1 Tax=Setaria italica TaxID=4555 RepID=A0A368RK53_SETIT|nr:LOW QUALITY PROTEIN: hypothetical protein SETIT_6G057800v2 [Setaria italica]